MCVCMICKNLFLDKLVVAFSRSTLLLSLFIPAVIFVHSQSNHDFILAAVTHDCLPCLIVYFCSLSFLKCMHSIRQHDGINLSSYRKLQNITFLFIYAECVWCDALRCRFHVSSYLIRLFSISFIYLSRVFFFWFIHHYFSRVIAHC